MASQVQIANRTMSKLGDERITSLSDDSKRAREINALFDIVRDAELRRNRWNFAMKRAALSALSDEPAWGYDYQYSLPSDCLRLDMIEDSYVMPSLDNYRSQENLIYRVEGGRILTNMPAPLNIRYIYRATNTEDFDALFVEVFASRMAYEACEALTQSDGKKQAMWAEYKENLRAAIKIGAVELPPVPAPDDAWVMGRILG
jgi:hypothetical protein